MRPTALGMVETCGLLGAVEAADAALKSASVSLVETRRVGGGLVTIFLAGDVGSVRVAVDAAVASLKRLGLEAAAHVIPRLAEEVGRRVLLPEGPAAAEPGPDFEAAGEKVAEPEAEDREPAPAHPVAAEGRFAPVPDEELERMTVAELRHMARKVSLRSMTKKQIRDSGKANLIRHLSAFFQDAASEQTAKRGEME